MSPRVSTTTGRPQSPRRPLARITFLLTAALISGALLIGLITYKYSFWMMETSYQDFYLNKAQMIVAIAKPYLASGDKELLEHFNQFWKAAGSRPTDEYICVVDKKGNLLLHTADPQSVGNYAGDNPILDSEKENRGRLCDLVSLQADYVGRYISSAGHDQIAAFVGVPGKNWVLGVHRSRSALHQEIEDGFRPFVWGFVLVCGLLMPLCLFILYRTYSAAHNRQLLSQEALLESERRYQSLVDTMPQCLYRTDLQGRIVFANQALLDFWGVSFAKCQGRDIGEYFPDEFAEQLTAGDLEVIRCGETTDVVAELPGPDGGRVRYLEMVRNPVRDARGEIIGVQGIFWDMTDKMRAQQELESTTAHLDTVLQSVPTGILAVDAEGRLTMVNNKAQELMGFDAAEALGKPVEEVVPNSELPQVLASRDYQVGKPYSWGDKSFLVSRSPIYEGPRIIGAVSIFQDESEMESVQRQLEEMKRLNDEYSTLVENSHDGVLIADCRSIIKVNSSFGRITGLVPSTLEGRDLAALGSGGLDPLDLVSEVIEQVIERGASLTLRRQLDGENEIFITGTPVLGRDGRVVRVVLNLRDVTELQSLEEQLKRLSSRGVNLADCAPQAVSGIVAESEAFKNVLELAMRVSRVDSTVLLSGESGVGKDVLARVIHALSSRAEKPFVAINCGAIPENLLESELFGYEKGAFSGADREGKPGLFEQAEGGTVFLDEVGELPLSLQVKLLKVLQERQCRRLGGVKTVDLDIRVLAATNRDLKQMVEAGDFRQDLFYRLYVVPIEVPALRRRRADIMPLALQFLKQYNKKYGVSRTLGHGLLQVLESYDWPGNVRELQNVVERMVVTADREVLEPRHLPDNVSQVAAAMDPVMWVPEGMTLKEARDHLEKQLIQRALSQASNLREAAKALGVTHPTVLRKAQKLGLDTDLKDGGDEPPSKRLH